MSEEINKLLEGNKQFRKKYFKANSALFDGLVQNGQKPKTMIVGCSDSRVDPAMILDCQPGELFVIRSMANLVPPCEDNNAYHGTSATLEFGTSFLQVEHIIIFGHTQCGGIQALFESDGKISDKDPYNFIAKWMEIALPAYHKVMQEHADATLAEKVVLCEQYALINSLNNLHSFPWVQERIAQGTLQVHAWYFELATGVVHAYDQENTQDGLRMNNVMAHSFLKY